MQLSPQSILVFTALLLLTWIEGVSLQEYLCPIGFQLAYSKHGPPICYRQKEPEAFADKFKDCTGNLYSPNLAQRYPDLLDTKQVMWTDYKTLYPGGPFIDWSYTETSGRVLLTTFDVNYDSSLGIDEELCVLVDPVSNFTAARCDEKHSRYCFVKPYDLDSDMDSEGCKSGFWRFYNPMPTCLTAVAGVGGGTVRATWRQAQDLCSKRGASILNKGWRYSNDPVLHTTGARDLLYPLGVIMDLNRTVLRYEMKNDTIVIPPSEWHFLDLAGQGADTEFGAVRGNFWRLVNSSLLFMDVICEHPVLLRNIELTINGEWEGMIMLKVNDTIMKSDIQCFTDSIIYYPIIVDTMASPEDSRTFFISPASDGYYWCIQTDQKRYHLSESNKALYIKSKESLVNVYACKIRLKKEFQLFNLDKLQRLVRKKLEQFIYYRTKYLAVYGELPMNKTEETLRSFKRNQPELDWKDGDVLFNMKLRRLYLDERTVLIHVTLNPTMMPAAPDYWDNVELVSMKPVYFCKPFDQVPMLELGQSATSPGCRTYTCVGDFNEGVQWVETAADGCATKPPVHKASNAEVIDSMMPTWPPPSTRNSQVVDTQNTQNPSEDHSSSEETTVPVTPTKPSAMPPSTEWISTTIVNIEVTTVNTPEPPTTDASTTEMWTTEEPTTPVPLAPEEQLQQVVQELEQLLDGGAVTIDSIGHSFDQVNEILEVEDPNLEIPGQLLHLLDKLASRVELVAGTQAMEVRDNVAILMADATPDHPVRGVRVAARDYDVFSNTSFRFIDGAIDSEELLRNASEAVVYLPESVSSTARRVSFVAFRNQRAFPSSLAVNSRVFSVNVENFTHFDDGEVIDIHLSPIVEEPERNQSRACVFWQFTEDGGGYWSQEGCTLIRAPVPTAMDTCRCNHLTHFAEVLVPRTVFSERDEAALEILTIIGCVLSIFGLAMIALTASLFRSWRRDFSNKIWLQLCISIFILVVCFLVVVFATFDIYNIPCMLVGVALHYSVLASFCWMLVAAVLSYRRLVLVFTRDMSHKLLRASAFSWGTPCAIVGILLSVDPQSYQGQFEEKTPSGAFCYPSGLGLWLAVYAPIAAMLLANWTLFALIVRSVFASRRIQRHGDSNEALRCASVSCLLVFLFGLPWIFGLFAYNVVAAYLFTLTATYQGFVLFIFFVLGNKKTRDLWLNKLKIKQTRKVPVTSSTFTHRSTGPGWRGGVEGATSIEAKTSKPRSLTSPDDSRFS